MTDATKDLELLLRRIDAPLELPEFHGMITGLACAGGNKLSNRHQTFASWLDANLAARDAALVEAAFQTTLDSLWAHSDLDLRLMIPEDETAIDVRGAAVFEWCDGFLAGFGAGVGDQAHGLSPDVSEILSDFAEISRFEDALDEGEENEQDLMQVIEYVRVSAALIFAELGKGPE